MTYYNSYDREQHERRQLCNQCRGTNRTYYCAPTDEYLCEDCEAYALKMVAEEENREFEEESA